MIWQWLLASKWSVCLIQTWNAPFTMSQKSWNLTWNPPTFLKRHVLCVQKDPCPNSWATWEIVCARIFEYRSWCARINNFLPKYLLFQNDYFVKTDAQFAWAWRCAFSSARGERGEKKASCAPFPAVEGHFCNSKISVSLAGVIEKARLFLRGLLNLCFYDLNGFGHRSERWTMTYVIFKPYSPCATVI